MTPAMQKTLAWYAVGVAIAGIFAWVRLQHGGGFQRGMRDPKFWRDLGLVILGVLLAPAAVAVVGVVLFMLVMWVTGQSMQ